MVSLFVLFSIFFKKSYSKNKNKKQMGSRNKSTSSVKESEDQCHKAMGEISSVAKDVANVAAKDAGRIVKTATKAATAIQERERFC